MQKDQIMISICIKILKKFKILFEFQFILSVRFFFNLCWCVPFPYSMQMKYFCVIAGETNYFKCKFLFVLMSMQLVKYSALFQTIRITFFLSFTNLELWSSENYRKKSECKKEKEDGKEKCNQRKGIKWDFKSNMYHFVTVALFCCRCSFFYFNSMPLQNVYIHFFVVLRLNS